MSAPDDGLIAIPCTWMRGGTSKGAFFLASDLPANPVQRDELLLAIMGSPDERQIDGIGGADPLTSKVAIVSKSARQGVDIEYFFLQVFVDKPTVTDAQNCGNILAAVAQFSVDQGLINPAGDTTVVNVYMLNSDQVATVTIKTNSAGPIYRGDASIDGVPGTSAAVLQNFPEAAGSNCGALLPSGNRQDTILGTRVTLIDNGMPVVLLSAVDLGISGYEAREALDANTELKVRLEAIRIEAGRLMNLGDVKDKTVPKMTMIAPARKGGAVCTRTFIPHRCHASIGVLGAVSVATACVLEGTVAAGIATTAEATAAVSQSSSKAINISVEHPIGETSVVMEVSQEGDDFAISQAAVVRTARKLFEGVVYAPVRE